MKSARNVPVSSDIKWESTLDVPESSELSLKESSPELASPDNSTTFKSESSKSMERPFQTSDIAKDFMVDLSVTNESLFQSKYESKSNRTITTTTTTNIVIFDQTEELREEHEGMLKLWEKERANLKKAQQLLLEQKDAFNQELDELEDSRQKQMDDLTAEYD